MEFRKYRKNKFRYQCRDMQKRTDAIYDESNNPFYFARHYKDTVENARMGFCGDFNESHADSSRGPSKHSK